MDIHGKMRAALRKCGCIGGNPACHTPDVAKKDFALRSGQLPRRFGQGFDRRIGQLGEVMALPVVASARSKQGIERLLPVGEVMGRDDIDDGLPDCPKLRSLHFRALHVSAMAHGKDQDLFAMPIRRQEWQRRGLSHDGPACQFVRRSFESLTIAFEHARRVLEGMRDEPRKHLRTDLMKLEFESGDDAEIPSAAAKSPEQIRLFGGAHAPQHAIGSYDIGRQEVVDRQAELSRDPAEPAAERQAGNSGRGVDSRRHGQSKRLRFPVDIGERGSRFDPRPLSGGVHLHGFHLRKIDDDAAVAEGVAGDVMPASADRNKQTVIACDTHRRYGIGGVCAPDDKTGLSVDHPVPDFSRLIIQSIIFIN